MSRRYTSPVTKILSCLHCAHHDEPAAFVLHLLFLFFMSTKSLLRTRHPSGSRLSEFNCLQPLAYYYAPENLQFHTMSNRFIYLTFSGSKSPTNYGSRHGQNSQSCNFHHDIISNLQLLFECKSIPTKLSIVHLLINDYCYLPITIILLLRGVRHGPFI